MGIDKIKDYGAYKSDLKPLYAYLAQRGVPASMVKKIRTAFINDAIQQSNYMKMDRVLTALALALRRVEGYGAKRIVRILACFDDISSAVLKDDGYEWTDAMEELRRKTGIIIRYGEGNRLEFEYDGTDEAFEGVKKELSKRNGEL